LSFNRHDFARPWCGATRRRDYLARLLSGGRLAPGPVGDGAALEWFFDLPEYRDLSLGRLPLGAIYSPEETIFRLWAPTASSVKLILFQGTDNSANGGADRSLTLPMQSLSEPGMVPGYWEIAMGGDLHGKYYRFRVCVHGAERDIADPFARACGINGRLSMVVDLARTDPPEWERLRAPTLESPNDAIAYELHVADVTSSPGWNGPERLRRTYEGASLSGTELRGAATGFDHIVGLGITHVQLMPVFDFSSVDESRVTEAEYRSRLVGGAFNWGYDPQNYCAPEGSYSRSPNNGAVRILELKALIGEFIRRGVGVVMDVVLNHVPSAQDHPLGISVPGYYFRLESFSGAGDDTASERAMFRAYMIDALRFWLREYKLSGFRFDLMGLHDVTTMNLVVAALREIKPDVLLYGEGWDMYRGGGASATRGMHGIRGASMIESRKLPGLGFFNDAFRCGIKGSAFSPRNPGFIHDGGRRESVKFGIVGAVYHPQVHNRLVIGTANPNPWSDRTAASVNYTEIHDNATLYDKLALVEEGRDEEYYERLQRTAIALVLFAQGMPVLHAGMEFMRTKEIPRDALAEHPELGDLFTTADGKRSFSHNSYNLSDAINGLDWERCADKQSLVAYTRFLIGLRRDHPLFRLRTGDEVVGALRFYEPEIYNVPDSVAEPGANAEPAANIPLCWTIDGTVVGDSWKSACIAVNTANEAVTYGLPPCPHGGVWRLVSDGTTPERGLAEPNSPTASIPEAGSSVVLSPKALYLYAEF
ncbi:MAG TPA: type I pullulanase, partial [Treponemataceae bacterium]|nr:type I pullulanase [Treponemataceae bacterium]